MESRSSQYVDNIFCALGPLKSFTWLQFFISGLGAWPAASQLLSNIFIARKVTHRCAEPQNMSDLLGEFQDYSNVTVSYHQCDIIVASNSTILKTESCIYGMHYDLPVDTSVISQFDLVCGSSSLVGLSQTFVFAGQGIGAALATFVSDRCGRKPVMIVSNLGLMACGLTIAYAPNFYVFAISKFFVGCFQQGFVTTFCTLSSEIFITPHRRLSAMLGGILWATAVMSLGLVAVILQNHSWRTLQMALSFFSLGFIFQIWFVKESLRWLLANGKSAAAIACIKYAAKLNGKPFESVLKAMTNEESEKLDTENDSQPSNNFTFVAKRTEKLSLLTIMRVRRLFLNAAIMWFAC